MCESPGVIVDSEDALVEEKVCCECVCEGGIGTAGHLLDDDGNCTAPITNGCSPSIDTDGNDEIGVFELYICESVGERSDEDLVTHMLASNLCTVLDGEYASHIMGSHSTSADTGGESGDCTIVAHGASAEDEDGNLVENMRKTGSVEPAVGEETDWHDGPRRVLDL